MRSPPGALATAYAAGSTTIATAIKITRPDATVFAYTDHDIDATISGVTYSADPGLMVSSIVSSAGLAVDNLELRTLHDGAVFTKEDIFTGAWRNSAFEIFRYNHASIAAGVDTIIAGTFGDVRLEQNVVVVELRSLAQYMQQGVGDVTSKNCRARLGDARCAKDLTAFTVTGTLTAVTSDRVFRDSGRAEAVNYFDEGEITFTSGACLGVNAKVKSYAANGTFTLALPMYVTPSIGDSYTAIAGCRKRLQEDCRDKFDNVLNFVGEPHLRGVDSLTKGPEPSV